MAQRGTAKRSRPKRPLGGVTVGASVEYAFPNAISLKTEYLYVDLGDKDLYCDDFVRLGVDTRLHVLRAGVNYRF